MATRLDYRSCRLCKRTAAEAGPISARGKCKRCADEMQLANTAQLRARSGPLFEHWYEQMRVRFEHPRGASSS